LAGIRDVFQPFRQPSKFDTQTPRLQQRPPYGGWRAPS
jgi:hypothetical protein